MTITKNYDFFTRNPSGFLFRHWNGSVQAGILSEQSPDGKYVFIVLDSTNTGEWHNADKVEIVSRGVDFVPWNNYAS